MYAVLWSYSPGIVPLFLKGGGGSVPFFAIDYNIVHQKGCSKDIGRYVKGLFSLVKSRGRHFNILRYGGLRPPSLEPEPEGTYYISQIHTLEIIKLRKMRKSIT